MIIIVNVHNNRAKYNITPDWTRLTSGYDSFMSGYMNMISGYDTLISWYVIYCPNIGA